MEVQEKLHKKFILWQDVTHPEGYRPTLTLLLFEDGSKAIEFQCFGAVVCTPYVFGYEEELNELKRRGSPSREEE